MTMTKKSVGQVYLLLYLISESYCDYQRTIMDSRIDRCHTSSLK